MKPFSPSRRAALAVLGLSACSPSLGTFDALTPKDEGRLVARDVAFGAEPRLKLDIYAPVGDVHDAPVLMFIYGGGWAWGNKDDYEFAAHAFTSHGYVCVVPNYRLVPEVRFPSFIEDCAAALRWTQDHIASFGGAPDRLVLCGHSAGAYNAVMLALDAHYCADSGVDMRAIKGAAGLAGPYDFYPFDMDFTINAFGQAPDPELTQPVHFARRDAPPLFLGWGARDDLVGRRNIDGLEHAMHQVGGSVETIIYPNADHIDLLLALSPPLRGRAAVLSDVIAFANRVTQAS